MLPSESHTRDFQRMSFALARGGLDLLGRGGSHPGDCLVDQDIVGSQQRGMHYHVLAVTIPS